MSQRIYSLGTFILLAALREIKRKNVQFVIAKERGGLRFLCFVWQRQSYFVQRQSYFVKTDS